MEQKKLIVFLMSNFMVKFFVVCQFNEYMIMDGIGFKDIV